MSGIVVGVDGSKDADAALLWALREGAWRSATVTAVVACGPDDCPETMADDARGDEARMAAAAHQVVQDALARLGTPELGTPGLSTVDLVERPVAADPVAALVEASRDADMLVIGHRGGGRLRRLLAGSVSSACLHQATVPVVVVRDGVLPPAEQGPVLVGVDGSDASIAALRWAAETADARFTSLRVLHSWSPVPPVYTGFYVGAGGGFDAEVVQKVAENVLNDSMLRGFGFDGPGVPTEGVLAVGSAARSLVEASEYAQLLVVGARGGGGFAELVLGSTSHQAVHHAHCPVAVLHSSEHRTKRGTGHRAKRGVDAAEPRQLAGPPAPRSGDASANG